MTTYTSTCDQCGWTSNPTRSQAQADHAHRIHSCDRWRAKAAAKARGQARDAAVDRTPKACHHKRANHQHGTHACYVLDKCRCHPCKDANTVYERNRIKQHAYGRFNTFVDAEPVRDHIKALQAAGMGLKQIVAATNGEFSQGAMTRLMYGRLKKETNRQEGPSRRIRTEHANALLAVRATTNTIAGGALIDGTGTRRRLQALIAIGWSQTRLAERMGYALRNFNYMLHGKRSVTVATHRKVLALYDDLWDTPPTARNRWELGAINRTITYARTHGWVPPLAWDDDTIDDPEATPHTTTNRSVRTKNRPAEHLAEDVAFVLEADPFATGAQVAARLGVTRDAVTQALKRTDRTDLINQLARNARLANGEAA